MQIHLLFPTAIATSTLDRPFTSLESRVWESANYYDNHTDHQTSPNGVSYTIESSILERPELANIKSWILEQVTAYVNEYKLSDTIELEIARSWIVRSKPGDFGRMHTHPNSLISGVLYLAADPTSGNLILQDSRTSKLGGMEFNYADMNQLNSCNVSIPPKPGNLVMFPGYLAHEVAHNRSWITRYSLAFDVWFRGSINLRNPMGALTIS